jgi:hypothetical protein
MVPNSPTANIVGGITPQPKRNDTAIVAMIVTNIIIVVVINNALRRFCTAGARVDSRLSNSMYPSAIALMISTGVSILIENN